MATTAAQLLRSPVAQFLATGLLTLAALMVGTGAFITRAAHAEALTDAQATTNILAKSVAEPALPRGLVRGDRGAIDRFDRAATDRLLVGDVRRIKIWSADGTIVYSDEVRLIHRQFDLGEEELETLLHGGSDAEISDLGEPENSYERGGGGLLEVYTQIWTPEGEPLLFEAYYSAAGIEERQDRLIGPFQRIILGALGVVVAVATAMLWVLTRRVTRAAAERERLLRSAADASDAERRRIARDLHDGVVQDLAGSAFTLSALARQDAGPTRTALLETGHSLRSSLRALRSLLVEIHPPDLSADSLPAALEDLVAPAAAAGVRASVDAGTVPHAEPQTVALVWRVAQEAVRNALRHSRATVLSIVVGERDGVLVLEVTDDGIGFDPARVSAGAHYGLRGLDSLVRDSGGTLNVRSAPGAGTTIRMEVRP